MLWPQIQEFWEVNETYYNKIYNSRKHQMTRATILQDAHTMNDHNVVPEKQFLFKLQLYKKTFYDGYLFMEF